MEVLLGLDTPISGRILLSGVNLRDLSWGSLRRGVMRVDTESATLHGSLKRVLSMGSTNRPEESKLELMAFEEGLGPLIKRLGGLDGTVWEGGRNLTKSEKLAICLIRIRLLRPRLIVMDMDTFSRVKCSIDAYLRGHEATIIRFASRDHGAAA